MKPESRTEGRPTVPGWERLRHGGLLLDATRLAALSRHVPGPLDDRVGRQLRQRAGAMSEADADSGTISSFVAFVLEEVCRFDASIGAWTRGSNVAPSWGRRAITGETVKPRHLWTGRNGARLPVFLDAGRRLGVGRGRRIVSQVLGWLRAGNDHLALVTNGRQWRLVFAGLDYDAWCEWDLDLWFEEGVFSPQVTALRTLLGLGLWTPETEDAAAPLLQAIRDTRKGQAELSEVLGERVREAVEILIRGHGEALSALAGVTEADAADYRAYLEDVAGVSSAEAPSDDDERFPGATPQDIYRAACRVAMRLVVILFAESRELLPRDNALYHESYGLNGLLERLERAATRGGALAASFGAWPRVLALFRLVRDGSHHPDLPVPAYGGDLFAAGMPDAPDGLSRALHVFENACFEADVGDVLPDGDVHEMLKLLTRTTIRIRQGRGGTRAVVPVDFSDLSSEYIGILYEGLLDYELKTAPRGDPVIFLSVGDQPALPLSRLEAMEDRAFKTLFERLKESSSAGDDAPDGGDASEPSDEAPALALETATESPGRGSADLFDGPDEHDEEAEGDALSLGVREASAEYLVAAADKRQHSRTRAETWARHAAQIAGLVRRPRGRETPERRLEFEKRLGAKARQLVSRVVLPGEWYLVRWGGNRKGSGSFYTRPGLAVPTVQRTLRPLAYDPPSGSDGTPDVDAPPARWTPKLPEEILALTVCDPACGSGTFPLAALRFLTDALYASLQHHGRIEPDGERALVRLLGLRGNGTVGEEAREGSTSQGEGEGSDAPAEFGLGDELIPCPPDDDRFEPRLKAVLRRHVVERCIYAVDLDPLAVELCRLSLWIETMDRTLPFGFLDHKVKCGNALIGVWFDQFRHYPVMAWKNREGGDKNHTNGVHFKKGARTKPIKDFVKDGLKPDLELFLQGADLFQEDLLEESLTVHDEALAVLAEMHALPVQDAAERARIYRERLLGSPAWRSLKGAMDLWCACWFWPAEELERAPLPSKLADPPGETRVVAERVAAEMRFFHWELEFPDVFREAGSGFDAILGNPPWDIAKPVSKEFFSDIDPLYRSYGKQEALRKQKDFFAAVAVERHWLDYSARFRAQSNFMGHVASPFGDPDENDKSQDRFVVARGNRNRELHDRWRQARARATGFGDPVHPFRHQGSADLNLYKLFLEAAHALLKPGGRLGFVVPSGLYSDNGTGALRRLFIERCRWEWLFGIENRDKIFPIDSRFKFNPVIVAKGGATEAIRTAFMRRKLDDWETAEEFATAYTREQVERFSPRSRAILEIQSGRDLEILEKIYANAVLLGDDGPDGWGIRYATEFHMTNDSRLFPPRPQWEAKGYRPDEYSRWLLGEWRPIEELWEELGVDPTRPEPVDIELEEWLFDTTAGPERREAEARLVRGHLLKPGDVARTDWRIRCAQPPYDRLPVPRARIPPGVILSRDGDAWVRENDVQDIALPVYQGIMIQPFVPSARGWISGTGLRAKWDYSSLRNLRWNPQYLMASSDVRRRKQSTCDLKIGFRDVSRDSDVRSFMGAILPGFPCGNSAPILFRDSASNGVEPLLTGFLNSFVFDWQIRRRGGAAHLNWYMLADMALPLCRFTPEASAVARFVSRLNLHFPTYAPAAVVNGLDGFGALNVGERGRLRAVVDAITAVIYGCSRDELAHILQDVELDSAALGSGNRMLDVRGFWRVDRDRDPELRHTVLTLVTFADLESEIQAAGGDREKGIDSFLTQNHGEGWMLPETLRLADYDLGNDERARHVQPVASRLGPRFYDWQLVQSTDESWRECHLHARNLLGGHEYAHLLVGQIERRVAGGEDYVGTLTDRFTRELLGVDGYGTVLFEIRSRDIVDEGSYWTTVTALRDCGELDENTYGQLLDKLHARGLLDDIGYRSRRDVSSPTRSREPLMRVAEPPPVYTATQSTTDGQPDLFERREQ